MKPIDRLGFGPTRHVCEDGEGGYIVMVTPPKLLGPKPTIAMKDHLFVPSGDGELYDTRVKGWSSKPPLRRNYQCHHSSINSVADFKATLRAGPYAWPGGYQLYFICEDGNSLCFNCARTEARIMMEAINRYKYTSDDGWRTVGCDVNWEDNDMICVHCNSRIPPACGDDE